jgi:hypothetical protein
MTVCEYIIAMKREINPRYNYVRYTIQFLSETSRTVGINKKFIDMTQDDILSYLDKSHKPEDEDPLHKWIGSYNIRCVILFRFFKWLYYPNISNPKKRMNYHHKKTDQNVYWAYHNYEEKKSAATSLLIFGLKKMTCYF